MGERYGSEPALAISCCDSDVPPAVKAVRACEASCDNANAFGSLGTPFLTIRSKLGGIAFGAAVLNELC